MENRQEFGVMVQQLSHEELEQLRVDETDSGRLRLVELELERHRMIKAEEACTNSSRPERLQAVRLIAFTTPPCQMTDLWSLIGR